MATKAVAVNTAPVDIPSRTENMPGFTARIYDIVRNDVIPANKVNITPDKIDSINAVKKAVAAYYSIHPDDLASTTKKREVVIPRQVAIYIVRDKYDIPLKKIGEHFGNRDHATILHSISKMEEFMKDDPDVKQDVENIVKKLK